MTDDGPRTTDGLRVGVVGAGITGLALTHELARRGVEVVTFEADDEPGGVMRSREVDDRVLEVGPQRLRLTDEIDRLVDEVGLSEEVVVADDHLPLYVYADGRLRLVPRSLRGFLTTDLLSWRAKLRVLREPLTDPADPDESAADLFTRKFGREAYENLVGPIFGGTYGSDPAEMPVRHALQGVMRLEEQAGSLLVPALRRILLASDTPPPATFEGGIQRLPEALAAEHDNRVRLGTAVEAVRQVDEGNGDQAAGDGAGGDEADDNDIESDVAGGDGTAGRYAIEAVDGDEVVDEVVLTTPADATADLVEGLAPESADALRELTYNPLALVHLESDVDAEGFGYQVRRDDPLRTLGVTWNASLFDRDNLYTAFLGGMHDPDVLDLDDGDLGDLAAREFEAVMDAPADVISVTKLPTVFPAYDRSWAALDRVDLPDGVRLATNYTARMGVPGRVREAVRVADDLAGSGRESGD